MKTKFQNLLHFVRNRPIASLIAVIAVSAFPIWVVVAQVTEPLPPENPQPSLPDTTRAAFTEEESWLAITQPKEFNATVEGRKTPEQKEADAFWRWAIENPAEFFKEHVETDLHYAARKEAVDLAILDPVKATAEAEARKTPAQKAEDARIRQAIEHPLEERQLAEP